MAFADDANALMYNPAGTTQIKSLQGSFMYAKPFANLDQVNLNKNFFSTLVPLAEKTTLGVAWTSLIAPSYREDTASLSLASELNRWSPSIPPDMSLGLQLNYLNHKYRVDDLARLDRVFQDDNDKSAYALSVSFLAKPKSDLLPGIRVGGSGKYLNEPDVGLASQDTVPRELALGIGYTWKRLNSALDVVRRDKVTDIRLGLETWLLNDILHDNQVGLRLGANRTNVSVGGTFARSFGNRFTLTLDYAFLFPIYVEETSGSHVASLGIRF